MPSDSATMATAENHRSLTSRRTANRRSCSMSAPRAATGQLQGSGEAGEWAGRVALRMYYVRRGERLTAICRQAARCWRAPSNCGINPLLISSKCGGVSVSPETAGLQRSFALDSAILAPGSAVNVDLSASTDADIALAILMDAPFPARENGEIALGGIGLSVSGNSPLAFSGN